MKRTTRLFPTSILIAIFLLSACAPAAPSPTTVPESVPPTEAEAAAPTPPEVAPEATAVPPTEAPVQAVATSRGPNLEATDPTTVSLASGQLQLVEFFRFT